MIPAPLPPNPPMEWDDRLLCEYEDAALRVGALDALFNSLPDKDVVGAHQAKGAGAALHLSLSRQVIRSLLARNEAVYSSRIEGTQSSLGDVLMDERGEESTYTKEDVREVRNCVEAYEFAMENAGQYISLELLLEIHKKLMQHDPKKAPGKLRDNWVAIGNRYRITFVPPPHTEVERCMKELLEFIEHSRMPSLAIAALAHVQFETIHPFFDGNGRLGRILIAMVLGRQAFASGTPLDLSRRFKEHQLNYYTRLQKVHESGEWEEWLRYFAASVRDAAQDSTHTISSLITTSQAEQARIREQAPSRQAKSIMRVYSEFISDPMLTFRKLRDRLDLTHNTVNSAVSWLEGNGIVKQVTADAQRGRVFEYARYREVLE